MKFNFLLILLVFLSSCKTTSDIYISNKSISSKKFSNSGFTLIYNDDLFLNKIVNKKMSERDLIVFQKNMKKGTSVKITNPYNDKTLLAKVGNSAKYPKFNNSVISLRIAKELELDPKEPYVIIDEVVDNNSFIAKKTKTFDEEKKVANKAPVDSISINDLNNNSTTSEDVSKKEKLFNYSIKIADFYYLSTAKDMNKRIKSEIFLNNSYVTKISENNFRVLVGPFSNIKSLQNAYNSVQKLNFENIEIVKND